MRIINYAVNYLLFQIIFSRAWDYRQLYVSRSYLRYEKAYMVSMPSFYPKIYIFPRECFKVQLLLYLALDLS